MAAAYAFVRAGRVAADIGCDHGKLSAALAGSGRCPLVLACDLRPGPLEKARVTCAPYGDKVQFRLGSGLAVLAPGEAEDIIIAGMGAETIIEILETAPWVFDARYNLVLVPATKHSILRRWLARRGFALRGETLCQAAGRLARTGGRFALVYRPERLAELFAALAAARLEPKRMQLLAYDRRKPPYAVLVEAVKDGGPGLEGLPVHYQMEP